MWRCVFCATSDAVGTKAGEGDGVWCEEKATVRKECKVLTSDGGIDKCGRWQIGDGDGDNARGCEWGLRLLGGGALCVEVKNGRLRETCGIRRCQGASSRSYPWPVSGLAAEHAVRRSGVRNGAWHDLARLDLLPRIRMEETLGECDDMNLSCLP